MQLYEICCLMNQYKCHYKDIRNYLHYEEFSARPLVINIKGAKITT